MNRQKFIRKRLQNIGVRYTDARVVARSFQFQLDNMGSVGLIVYLKRVGDQILNYLYGVNEKVEWVHTRKKFPAVFYPLKKYPEDILLRVAKIARSITLDDLQPSQVDKVVTAVITPYTGTIDRNTLWRDYLDLGLSASGLKPSVSQPTGPDFVMRHRNMVLSSSGPVSQADRYPFEESIGIVHGMPSLQVLPYLMDTFLPAMSLRQFNFREWDGYVGEIHAAQEPGGKLRMFASPYTVIQCLLEPIHNWIVPFRQKLKTDCTYDQESGAIYAQEHLEKGLTVHSVDLSTATCRFPIEPQLYVLERLGLGAIYIDALQTVCRGKWKVGDELRPSFPATLSWVVGQPLGIKPSMSMFSLTHNLLLAGMCKSIGISPLTSFRVLGDDVVIFNDDLHSLYTSAMSDAGVPVSHSKSFSSNKFAEFAGFSISGKTRVRAGKWREAGALNHLSLAESLGTPLFGESQANWLIAEKLALFVSGEFDPPVAEWPRFIKASADLFSIEDLCMDIIPCALPFQAGAAKYLKKIAIDPNVRIHQFYDGSPLDLAMVLPEGPHRNQLLWMFQMSSFDDNDTPLHVTLRSNYQQLGVMLHNMVMQQEIKLSDAREIALRARNKAISMLFHEPTRIYARDNTRSKKLLKAWEEASTVMHLHVA